MGGGGVEHKILIFNSKWSIHWDLNSLLLMFSRGFGSCAWHTVLVTWAAIQACRVDCNLQTKNIAISCPVSLAHVAYISYLSYEQSYCRTKAHCFQTVSSMCCGIQYHHRQNTRSWKPGFGHTSILITPDWDFLMVWLGSMVSCLWLVWHSCTQPLPDSPSLSDLPGSGEDPAAIPSGHTAIAHSCLYEGCTPNFSSPLSSIIKMSGHSWFCPQFCSVIVGAKPLCNELPIYFTVWDPPPPQICLRAAHRMCYMYSWY